MFIQLKLFFVPCENCWPTFLCTHFQNCTVHFSQNNDKQSPRPFLLFIVSEVLW